MTRIPDDVRAAAMADLATGEQPAVVAQRYRLNRQTVKAWRARVQPVAQPDIRRLAELAQRPAIEERQARIADLIIEVLEARLAAQRAIAQHVSTNTPWIIAQTAAELAALDGHLHRSAVDVLDRMASARSAVLADTGAPVRGTAMDDVAS